MLTNLLTLTQWEMIFKHMCIFKIIYNMPSESEVAQLCPTLSNPMDCTLPGSCVHGILQARVLEWVAIIICLVLPNCI